eukprot:3302373-Ditylum_brightwellii.AAC.1
MFCTNYGASKGHFPPCLKSWCAGCYRMSSGSKFPRVMPTNNLGIIFKQQSDNDKCLVARNGDWLSALFQCKY